MKTALISDIHGDIDALKTVLADIARSGCERTLCLGDLVDGGDASEDVVRLVQERNIVTVRGNHDEFPSSPLSRQSREFLSTRPEEIIEGAVLYTHISPHRKKRKVNTPFEAWNIFDEFPQRLFFIGHIHVPLIWGEKCEHKISATRHEFVFKRPFVLEPQDRYVICVGAVGQTRDWCPRLCYAIYDSSEQTVIWRKLDN